MSLNLFLRYLIYRQQIFSMNDIKNDCVFISFEQRTNINVTQICLSAVSFTNPVTKTSLESFKKTNKQQILCARMKAIDNSQEIYN